MKVLLELKNVSKSFQGNHVLNLTEMKIFYGEVHALLGENGAGKSTLVKIIVGALQKDSGEVIIDGIPKNYKSTREAYADYIAAISQETNLVPELSVLENVFLGQEAKKGFGRLDIKTMLFQFYDACQRMNLNLNPFRKVGQLDVAQKKLLEIIKALLRCSKLLIMDEPTDALSMKETGHLFSIIRDLKSQGVSTLFITHKLDEIFEICDRVTILRDGRKIRTLKTTDTTIPEVVSMMIGEPLKRKSEIRKIKKQGVPFFKIKDLKITEILGPLSLGLYPGEILGLTGLIGSGKTKLAETIFGVSGFDSGNIYLNGNIYKPKTPMEAIRQGVFLVPEDRSKKGLNLDFELYKNVTLSELKNFFLGLGLKLSKEISLTDKLCLQLRINTKSSYIKTSRLSGGNQQKLMIAKWLHRLPKILVLDEPTRGIDIKARKDIFAIVRKLANEGCCILYISADIKEIKEIADRILVMHSGTIVAEYDSSTGEKDIIKSIFKI